MPKWLRIQWINYHRGLEKPSDPEDWREWYRYYNRLLGPFSFDKEDTKGRRMWAWANRQLRRARWMYDYSAISVGLVDGPPQHVDGKPRYSTGGLYTALGNADDRGLDLKKIAERLVDYSDLVYDADALVERYHERK